MLALENALVVLFDGNRAYSAYTDENGKVSFPNVIAGTYKIIVYKEDYITAYGEVEVTEDKSLSFTLTKPVRITQGQVKYVMTLQGTNTKFQSVVSVQALEINISINNAIMVEVIN